MNQRFQKSNYRKKTLWQIKRDNKMLIFMVDTDVLSTVFEETKQGGKKA